MARLTDPEACVLWLIILLPVFLSLVLYLYVRYLTSTYPEDEEIAGDPPSYLASHQDRLFATQLWEKPPDYFPSPPPYDDEELTLDQVKQNVLSQKRQRLALLPLNTDLLLP